MGDQSGVDARVIGGRDAFARRAWRDAVTHLRAADEQHDLGVGDVERLAIAAHLTGHVELAVATLERLHHALLDDGDLDGAARWAVWLAIILLQRGRHAQGGGWLARAARLLDEADLDCAARGYLLVPTALQALNTDGEQRRALELFGQVGEIAARFDDPDLAVIGLLGRGQSLVAMAEVERGLPVLDEVMVAVTTGDVSPIMAGMAYCAVILACREVFDLRRAQEWTGVLSRWCADQQDLQPYQGQCLVHRSEIMQLHGDWTAAMIEVEHACDHLAARPGDPVMGMARYQQAELLRLRGDLDRAEDCYRQVTAWGHADQPGLALLRLAQGRIDEAASAVRRAVEQAETDRVRRAQVLAAFVEVTLAAGDVDAATSGADELREIAADFDSVYLRAVAAEQQGAALLASGDAERALEALRPAWQGWTALDAPYQAARVRVGIARACSALGDRDTAELELAAARQVFQRLRAAPALREVDAVSGSSDSTPPGGLTPREVEVLALVATGATNREVAEALVISEKTVARHLSNMFTKLGIGSRTAATAWAYEHGLV